MIPVQYKGKIRKRKKASKVRSIDLNDVRIFLFQVLRGLAYCHDRRILHRDLKDSFKPTSADKDTESSDSSISKLSSRSKKRVRGWTLPYQNGPCFVNFSASNGRSVMFGQLESSSTPRIVFLVRDKIDLIQSTLTGQGSN